MQRKHGELGPIGEVVSGLDDVLVPTIRDASPQARHHFTQADQVNQLATAREADPDRGFMARMMVLCSLPRSNPGNRIRYVRRNGPYTLVMNAGGLHKLPFGNLPRLLLAWASTEAVKTGKRDLVLGRSLSGFMRKLDMSDDSGSPRGDRTRLRNQMKRLFNASVQLIYEDATVAATASSFIADRSVFWWNERKPDEQVLFNSEIRLSEAFFNEIIRHPVPLDMNILKALKRCALGLNLYLWINYRTFALRAPLRLSWRQVYRQFGVDPAKASDKRTVLDFRRKGSARAKEDQAGLAGVELLDASGRLDPAPFDTGYRAGWTSPTHKLITRFRAVSGASAALLRRVGPLHANRRGIVVRPQIASFHRLV